MKSLCFVLFLALSMPACSHFTETGRQRHAFVKQTKKADKKRKQHQHELLKQRQLAAKSIPPAPPVSEPQMTVTTGH